MCFRGVFTPTIPLRVVTSLITIFSLLPVRALNQRRLDVFVWVYS